MINLIPVGDLSPTGTELLRLCRRTRRYAATPSQSSVAAHRLTSSETRCQSGCAVKYPWPHIGNDAGLFVPCGVVRTDTFLHSMKRKVIERREGSFGSGGDCSCPRTPGCACVCARAPAPARARRLGRLLASESVSDGGGLEKCRESLRQPHRHCTAHKLLPAGLASHASVHERERLCFVLCASTVFQRSPRAGGPAAVRMTHTRVPFLPLRANSASSEPHTAL